MTSVESKTALLVLAVLVGLLAWPLAASDGAGIASGWSGSQRPDEGHPLGQRFRLIHPARGPPAPTSGQLRCRCSSGTVI